MTTTARMHRQPRSDRFCLPVQQPSISLVEAAIAKGRAHGGYDFYEVWLDLIDAPIDDLEALVGRLMADLGEALIVLLRRPGLEPIRMPPVQRERVMAAMHRGTSLLDLDIVAQADDLVRLNTGGWIIPTILSLHDYTATPATDDLRKLVAHMRMHGASICKVATHCRDQQDALRLMALTVELQSVEVRHIVIGLGSEGRMTRVYGALQGNAINFAPIEGSARSAPGQLTFDEFTSVLHIFRSESA